LVEREGSGGRPVGAHPEGRYSNAGGRQPTLTFTVYAIQLGVAGRCAHRRIHCAVAWHRVDSRVWLLRLTLRERRGRGL